MHAKRFFNKVHQHHLESNTSHKSYLKIFKAIKIKKPIEKPSSSTSFTNKTIQCIGNTKECSRHWLRN